MTEITQVFQEWWRMVKDQHERLEAADYDETVWCEVVRESAAFGTKHEELGFAFRMAALGNEMLVYLKGCDTRESERN